MGYTARNKFYNRIFSNIAMLAMFVSIITVICYLGLMNNAIGGIVNSDDNQQKINDLKTDCQRLEGEYLALVNNIDLDLAISLGFIEKNNDFIDRGQGDFVAKR